VGGFPEGAPFGEVIAMISPPGEDTQDAQRWWQAYLLAENDQADELRERATAGGDHAR
jgi:hypothetical protein